MTPAVAQTSAEPVPYQVDFVVGEPNETLGESEDDFYGRQRRLIQYAHGNADGVTERDTWINSLDSQTRGCVSTDPIEVGSGTASVSFTVAEGCELTLSLVSYTLPGGAFSFETAEEQEMIDATTGEFGSGDHTIEVGLPTGAGSDLPAGVTTETYAAGFDSPVGVEFPGGVGGRGYVVDQYGRMVAVDGGETSTFLDVRDRLADLPEPPTEMGLLGAAFHPDFPEDGRVFVRYSAPPTDDTPSEYSHTFVLSEFEATPEAADPDSERVLLEIPEPQSNHNAGDLAFGPDGLLYVAVGDGGAADDQGLGHVDDWYDAVDGGNGQDITQNLLGSVLRIDPDGGDDEAYGVPADNPLVGEEGLDEQYAWGFRNPWRFSFDSETGDLYVGDVGQGMWEEVDRVEAGGNYGWNVYEGTHPFMADSAPETTPDGEPLLPPVVEYPHESDETDVTGICVIGGYVYRGSTLSGLEGQYVFADLLANGRLFVADPREDVGWPVEVIGLGGVGGTVRSFGEDTEGELYVCAVGEGGGTVYKITGTE